MSFPTGWTSSRLTIDSSKVSGTSNLTDFPVLINDVALGTTGIGTAIWTQSQGQEINTNRFLTDANLQAYYRLESDGTDDSGNNYTLSGTAPSYTTAKFGNGGSFTSASTQYLTGSATNANVTTSQSWSVWLKPNASMLSGTKIAFGFANNSENRQRILYFVSGSLIWQIQGVTPSSTPSYTFIADNWYHIVCVYNTSTSTIKTYINGTEIDTDSTTGSATAITSNLTIGRREGYNDLYFDGTLDDIAIFDRALSDSEILELYQGGADIRITTDSAGSNVVNHEIVSWDSTNEKGEIWAKLGTVQATTDTSFYIWYDNGTATSTSNGTAVWSDYEVVLHNVYDGINSAKADSFGMTSVTSTNGVIGTAGNFDGTASFGTYSSINPFGTVTTLQGWFKPETINASGGRLFQQGNSLMHFSNEVGTTARLTLNVDFSSADGQWYDTNNNYNVNANNFVGVTLNSSSTANDPVFYNNGGTVAITESVTPIGTAVDISAGTHYLGDNGSLSRQFDGIIDEYRIRYSILSADWIATEYNNQNDPATFILTAIDFTRAISDNLSITDVIYREADFNRENTDNLAITDTVIRTFDQSITIQDNIVIITDQVVTTAVNVIAIATDIVGIDDTIFRQVDYSRNPQDTITLDDITDRSITYNRILDNSVGITDTISYIKFIFASVLDNIGISDSVNIKTLTSDVDNPIIEFYQIEDIAPTIYNITNG